jgi:hypothetical protein
MSGGASFVTRHTRRGAGASFYGYMNFSADSRTWTCAYCLKCPSITSGPSIDAANVSLDGIRIPSGTDCPAPEPSAASQVEPAGSSQVDAIGI